MVGDQMPGFVFVAIGYVEFFRGIPILLLLFFIFIVVLSGTLILSDQKYDNITIEQYLKLVGLLSLLSFTVGYDPSVFLAFFQRVGQWTNSVGTQPTRR